MIVVDVGCAEYGGDVSVRHLIDEFHPRVIYGFDPALTRDVAYGERGTSVFLEPKAAWLYDGEIGYVAAGLSSWLTDEQTKPRVACFDLAGYLHGLAADNPGEEIVLKIDAEGSEYDLLDRLVETGADRLLKLCWVEWHARDWYPEEMRVERTARRASIEERIGCEMAEWNH